jgi:hypothetical protein
MRLERLARPGRELREVGPGRGARRNRTALVDAAPATTFDFYEFD